nr:LOW QUALITY PROTEIN: atrial natriuretic peptide receptor 2-like [Lepeophtheirus salmonis]
MLQKRGVYGLRYFTTGNLDRVHYHSLIKNEMLRNEYLNQTFNFIPSLRKEYENNIRSKTLEDIYHGILEKNASEIGDISYIVNYFSHQIKYQRNTRLIIEKLAKSIGKFVEKEFQKYNSRKIIPLVLIILLSIFIPIVVYITLQASASMFRYSTLYDEKVSIFRQEKKKNEKLLTELLPLPIIREMKRGLIPRPVAFSSVTIFLCDIVGFTKLASESTAQQIIQFLNSLYNLFDSRLENYDVYKVETIGDAYMVASGIPIENENHAPEIAKMSLDIIAKVVTFEVQHKPGYRLRIRVGIHSGDCVGGVVGSKIPHYSIFGSTVDIAGQLEALSKPMKIQISDSTKSLLEKDGTFTISSRGSPIHIKGFGSVHTYWLLGRKVETNSSYISDGKSSNYR